MSLGTYRKKRNFKKTNEPAGGNKPESHDLIFVVQKHNASRLHYDFRLELDGVLKSWAVPKGPSMNPAEKRLAMMVEDHPFDYRDFEGVIPEGNYGAGEVIIWDTGVYLPAGGGEDKKKNEKLLKLALKKGDLKIVLLGKKLKGEFALVNMKNDEKSWLLLKKNDEFAGKMDILKKNESVKSGKTIESLKKNNASKKANNK